MDRANTGSRRVSAVLDRSSYPSRSALGVHPLAGRVMISVSDFRQNLAKLIESNAWDAGEPKN
jgi:hypothetical protein